MSTLKDSVHESDLVHESLPMYTTGIVKSTGGYDLPIIFSFKYMLVFIF